MAMLRHPDFTAIFEVKSKLFPVLKLKVELKSILQIPISGSCADTVVFHSRRNSEIIAHYITVSLSPRQLMRPKSLVKVSYMIQIHRKYQLKW